MSDLSTLGKFVAIAGATLLVLGGLIWLAGRIPALGHLPGDIRLQRGNVSCFFPLTTMIIVSVLLTVILNIILRLLRK
jgi:Protein of unknown function (DUF2905)